MKRLMDKVVVSPDGCWIFTGAKTPQGYGRMWHNGRNALAHRVSYELYYGPTDLTLDHLCQVRACVNPDHLEPVTDRENKLRSSNPRMRAFLSGTCLKGHVMDGKNVITEKSGRRCRTCRNERRRARPVEATTPQEGRKGMTA